MKYCSHFSGRVVKRFSGPACYQNFFHFYLVFGWFVFDCLILQKHLKVYFIITQIIYSRGKKEEEKEEKKCKWVPMREEQRLGHHAMGDFPSGHTACRRAALVRQHFQDPAAA